MGIDPDQRLLATGACYVHDGVFSFNPDTVPSVLVDPATGLPGDHPNATPNLRREELVARPVCPDCVDAWNAQRVAKGLPRQWQ